MRPGTYEEIPRLKRLCLRHRLMLIPSWFEDEDFAVYPVGAPGQTRRDALLKAVLCARCRSRNGLAAIDPHQG